MERPPKNVALPELARLTVEKFILDGERLEPPADVQGALAEHAGVFVTLRSPDGQLRGCIGTIEPSCATVAEEIIQNAISAATRDPRFHPVAHHELAGMKYGVDVLACPEPARGPEDLNAAHYGVIIETLDGSRRGLLLPRIEGIETVEAQWRAVHLKAGITPGTPVRLERFTVTRFGEE
ncbi:MAG: AmmeMemoRadiSam system protein A [Blastocatellia bacterium]